VYVSPVAAAARLGVSVRRIYDLVKAQRLRAVRVGGRLLVDSDAVESVAGGGARVGRPLSPRRAWGLILLAGGEDPRALDAVTKSKLRRMLRERDVWSMRARLSGRAKRLDLRAHPSDLRRIEDEPGVVRTGPRFAAGAGIPLVAADATPEYYVDGRTADRLITTYRLTSTFDPNVVLRIVPDDVWPWMALPLAPRIAIALDVAEDHDARSRDAAHSVLAR
jgi:excisionase family DNA binding protein